MEEYIEKSMAFAVLVDFPGELSPENIGLSIARKTIDGLPAADVAPVRHGRWIELSRASKCSECGFETGRYEPPRRYCPECGALMDGNETPTCHDGVCEIPGMEEWG